MRIGFSEIDITPEPGYPLGGYLERYLRDNRATGVLNNIFADIIYIDEDEGLMVISLETIAVEESFYRRIHRIVKKHGIKHLILASTHTHSAPETILNFPFFKKFIREYRKEVEKYLDFLEDRLKIAIEEAVDDVKNQEIYLGTAKIAEACSSRINPKEGREGDAVVLRFGKRILLHYACHPTVLSAKNMMYSGDFFSYTREELRNVVNGMLILNGAAGDLSTRFVRREQTPREAERIGRIVARGAIEAIKSSELISPQISLGSLRVRVKRRDLEKEGLEDKLREKIEWAKEEIHRITEPGERRKLENEILVGRFLLENLRDFEKEINNLPSTLEIELIFFRLGNIGFVSLPFELYSSLGRLIYEKTGSIVIGYANNYLGYAPTKDAYEELDYEAIASIISAGEAEKMTEKIVEEVAEM